MHEQVSINGKILLATDAGVSALSAAGLYGKGIFTTLAISNDSPILWEKHWHRLEHNARKLKIDLTEFSEYVTKAGLDQIIRQNKISKGRARITFFDESASTIWPFETAGKTSLLITTGDLRPVPENFRLFVSPYSINSRSPLAGIKSCNYLEKIIALDEAKTRGLDEAVQLNERGEITSGVMANVFWLRDDVLYTPSLETGCLPGTTREFVLENLDCREVEATLDDLNSVDSIFLTSAGLGVVPVAEFEAKQLKKTDHPILHLLPQRR